MTAGMAREFGDTKILPPRLSQNQTACHCRDTLSQIWAAPGGTNAGVRASKYPQGALEDSRPWASILNLVEVPRTNGRRCEFDFTRRPCFDVQLSKKEECVGEYAKGVPYQMSTQVTNGFR